MIVKPSSLGDIIHALPSFAALRKARPESRITWIANSEWIPLLQHVPGIDVLLAFPRSEFRGPLALAKFLRWAWIVRTGVEVPGETVFDLQGLLRSALIARSRPSAQVIGSRRSREGASFLYHTRAPDPGPCHAVDHCLSILRAGGIPCPEARVEFPLGPGDRPQQPLPERFVLVHPYSRGLGKSLSEEGIQTLLEALSPAEVVLVGRPPEGTQRPASAHIVNLCESTTLGELLWLCRNATSVLSVDSGPLHIAAAVNQRVIGIHTWSDPRRVGPYSPAALVWKAGRLGPVGEVSEKESSAGGIPCREDLLVIATALLKS